LALLVIPELKLSDKGLFDGKNFCFVPLSRNKGNDWQYINYFFKELTPLPEKACRSFKRIPIFAI
jgi:hypothetical protein